MSKNMQTENKVVPPKSAVVRKKRTSKLPINWFDMVMIVVIIVAAVLAFGNTQLASLLGFGQTTEVCTVEYMVLFSDVDQSLALAVSENVAVYSNATGAVMGIVTEDPEVSVHNILSYADGSAKMKEKPGSVDVIVTVRANAEYVAGEGYSVGDVFVRVGDNLSLRFPDYTGVGSCINIVKVSD